MNLLPLPALTDNYIWMLHDAQHAMVVDPGDWAPVWEALQSRGLSLQGILVTHHHGDHVGGVGELRERTGAVVYGPAAEATVPSALGVAQGDKINLLGVEIQVLDVPGHTAGHIAYFCPDVQGMPVLFCGDTLFSGGCGRLFEGTPAQMHASLTQLSALPDTTRVCCAHEYTLSNLRFALAVEPDNAELIQYNAWCQAQRSGGLPTLPSTMALERNINPFLRVHHAAVAQAAKARDPQIDSNDATAVLASLRTWKNEFR